VKLLIIIVNYRTPDLTIDAVASVAPEVKTVAPCRLVVVDNASGDGSADRIRAAFTAHGWGSFATFVASEHNGGFSYGNNLGLRAGTEGGDRPEYVLLLNPDTVVRPGALAALVAFMDEHRQVGIAGSRLEHPDGTPQLSAFRFPGVLSELEAALRLGVVTKLLSRWQVAPPIPEVACPMDWVAGASMIIREKVLDTVGFLDEGYFMYYEEVDFCLRARRAGWPCWYVPQSRVVHLVGRASGVTDPRQSAKRRPAYWFDSRRRYFLRNLGPLRTGLADAAFTAGFALWRARRVVQRKPDNDPDQLLSDFVRHSVFSKGFSA
jgi:GT2 family glycosyltransferase